MTECVVKNGYELRVYLNQQEIIPVLLHGSSNRVLLNFDSLSTFAGQPFITLNALDVFLHTYYISSGYFLHPILQTERLGKKFVDVGRCKFDAVKPPKFRPSVLEAT